MPIGPGKYDEELTALRERLGAYGVILVVFGGVQGSGFSAQLDPELTAQIPEILEDMARQIRADRPGGP